MIPLASLAQTTLVPSVTKAVYLDAAYFLSHPQSQIKGIIFQMVLLLLEQHRKIHPN